MNVCEIVDKITSGYRPDVSEVSTLLSARGEDAKYVFSTAARVRDAHFGKRTFIYGFVYFSTYCRNNCSFCYYRRTNDLERYRKSPDEIISLSHSLKDAGINLVDLTMGEDPHMCANGYSELIEIVRRVKEEVDISVMVSPGSMPENIFAKFKDAGADWFACYQETYNRDLFKRLRLEQDFDHRVNQRIWARKTGLLAEDGMMVGLGETVMDRAEALLRMGESGCEQIRAMTFVPQSGTPMEVMAPADAHNELISIATMRILFPERFIPASLDVEGIAGLKTRIDAGANVITSIIPPNINLAGVAQHELDIDNGHRSVNHVLDMLNDMGRRAATNSEYESALANLRKKSERDHT